MGGKRNCLNCQHLLCDLTNYGRQICTADCFKESRFDLSALKEPFYTEDCNFLSISLTDKLLISVISLGTRNDLLERTINSIARFNDLHADVVLTVDGVREVPEDFFPNVVVHNVGQRVGICEALNRSLSDMLADYRWVMFCDDDIEMLCNVSRFIRVLKNYPEIGAVGGHHDCRLKVNDYIWLNGFGKVLIKPITSGCHLVMRTEEVLPMMPFKGGHWEEGIPFLGFDHWVLQDSPNSIINLDMKIATLPNMVRHLGEGRSTWEGKAQEALREVGIVR